MRNLYPKINPNQLFFVDVGQGHQIYVEEVGNPNGIPVLFLHGGPGSGCHDDARRFFNPDLYRVILFDQRGCGRSRPFASTIANTTQHLIGDIEAIRIKLNVSSWLLFGGSWGATLALLYAQKFAKYVTGMILRGVFLGRKKDLDWIFANGGVSEFFPDVFESFHQVVAEEDDGDSIAQQYASLMQSDNDFVRQQAIVQWSRWENQLISLDQSGIELPLDRHLIQARSLISNHYVCAGCFIEENQIMANIATLSTIPTTIVHGRFDMICRLEQATTLASALPNAELQIVPKAGHSMFDVAMVDALVKACDDMAKFIQEQKKL